ncbi:hypothetical protein, partial [Burkholderia sp. MSMB1552]|uniref:hypothetical protein n=1 Tax=Burkholderia sp. MSMB1552 TaxID=1636424 RepID=UPI001E398323
VGAEITLDKVGAVSADPSSANTEVEGSTSPSATFADMARCKKRFQIFDFIFTPNECLIRWWPKCTYLNGLVLLAQSMGRRQQSPTPCER